MAKNDLVSPQQLKSMFHLDYGPQMMTWLRDYCHKYRRGNSYQRRVIKMLVERGYTVSPNFIRGLTLRYEDPSFQVRIDGTVTLQTPGPYSWDNLAVWAQTNGFTMYYSYMFDKDGNKYMSLCWKQYPNRIEVMTNKGLMFSDPNGILRGVL